MIKPQVNIPEELAEEIATIIAEPMAAYIPERSGLPMGLTYAKIDKKMATQIARQAIIRTLFAVRDDRQKLPGEVGRETSKLGTFNFGGVLKWLNSLPQQENITFIAFRREEER